MGDDVNSTTLWIETAFEIDKMFDMAIETKRCRCYISPRPYVLRMALRDFGGKKPTIGEGVFIDPSAQVIGDVRIKDAASIWPGAIVRGDDDFVEIGRGSAVMDLAFVEGPRGRPARVGSSCIISHAARLHGCEIGDESVVGIGAIVLDGAIIGPRSIIAAACLIPPGARIPPESFVVGMPGKVTRQTGSADLERLKKDLRAISDKAKIYLSDSGNIRQ